MRVIELNAAKWRSKLDFYDALLNAIGAPPGHGHSANALVDSMIWGGMNAVEPPYTVRIVGTAKLPDDIRNTIELVKQDLTDARAEFRRVRGEDVEVQFEADL